MHKRRRQRRQRIRADFSQAAFLEQPLCQTIGEAGEATGRRGIDRKIQWRQAQLRIFIDHRLGFLEISPARIPP